MRQDFCPWWQILSICTRNLWLDISMIIHSTLHLGVTETQYSIRSYRFMLMVKVTHFFLNLWILYNWFAQLALKYLHNGVLHHKIMQRKLYHSKISLDYYKPYESKPASKVHLYCFEQIAQTYLLKMFHEQPPLVLFKPQI